MKTKDKNTSFYSSGSYGCVFYPRINCTTKNIKKKNIISKVSLVDFYSKNEYNIGSYLKSLKLKNNPYLYIEQKCLLKKKQLPNINNRYECPILKKKRSNKKYIIFYLKYIKSQEISDYFSNNFTLKIFFRFYTFAIKYINLLNKNFIIHKDLHMGNILIDNKSHFHIIDFGLSINTKKYYLNDNTIDYDYLKNIFLSFDPSWKYWSIENHILCFFIYEKKQLTENELKKIINKYYTNNTLFNILFDDINLYKKKVFNYCKKKFINQENNETQIRKILDNCSSSWDLYLLNYNVLYLLIKKDIQYVDTFKEYIMNSLHYDYSKRPNHLELMKFIYYLLKDYDIIKISKKNDSYSNELKEYISHSSKKLIY